MITKDVIGFLECIKDDPAVLTGLGGKSSLEEVVKVAREKGFTITAADLGMAMKIIEAIIKKTDEKKTGELSEEDLAQVAGGLDIRELAASGPRYTIDDLMMLFSSQPQQRDERFEHMTNLMKRLGETMAIIAGNMR